MIGMILIKTELGFLIYAIVTLVKNNAAFQDTIHEDMPGYSWYMTGIILGFILFLACNILLIYGSSKNNRYYLVPWLIVYMITIIGLAILAIYLVIIWSAILFIIPSLIFVVLLPIISDIFLIYWWMVVNGRFISLGLSEVQAISSGGRWA